MAARKAEPAPESDAHHIVQPTYRDGRGVRCPACDALTFVLYTRHRDKRTYRTRRCRRCGRRFLTFEMIASNSV